MCCWSSCLNTMKFLWTVHSSPLLTDKFPPIVMSLFSLERLWCLVLKVSPFLCFSIARPISLICILGMHSRLLLQSFIQTLKISRERERERERERDYLITSSFSSSLLCLFCLQSSRATWQQCTHTHCLWVAALVLTTAATLRRTWTLDKPWARPWSKWSRPTRIEKTQLKRTTQRRAKSIRRKPWWTVCSAGSKQSSLIFGHRTFFSVFFSRLWSVEMWKLTHMFAASDWFAAFHVDLPIKWSHGRTLVFPYSKARTLIETLMGRLRLQCFTDLTISPLQSHATTASK